MPEISRYLPISSMFPLLFLSFYLLISKLDQSLTC
nr:MAG TPA: hypothetical protein [Caudoviricetes sp.]